MKLGHKLINSFSAFFTPEVSIQKTCPDGEATLPVQSPLEETVSSMLEAQQAGFYFQ
jgi:hypothetical protein